MLYLLFWFLVIPLFFLWVFMMFVTLAFYFKTNNLGIKLNVKTTVSNIVDSYKYLGLFGTIKFIIYHITLDEKNISKQQSKIDILKRNKDYKRLK